MDFKVKLSQLRTLRLELLMKRFKIIIHIEMIHVLVWKRCILYFFSVMNEINSDVPMVLKLIQIINDKLSVGTSILQFLEFNTQKSQF